MVFTEKKGTFHFLCMLMKSIKIITFVNKLVLAHYYLRVDLNNEYKRDPLMVADALVNLLTP